jgi:hypothetical protein
MKSRLQLLPGAVLLVLGIVAIANSSRVLSTFLLEVVAQTIRSDTTRALEPFDYSWGTMHWGQVSSHYSILCVGLFLIAFGQFLILPAAVGRIKSSAVLNPSKFPKVALIGASILTVLAAVSFLLIAIVTRNALGTLAMTSIADPVNLGEDLPVRTNGVFMICLVVAQLLILVAAFAAPHTNTGSPSRGGEARVLTFGACGCLLLFALLIAFARLGPIAVLADVEALRSAGHPTMIAGQLSLALNIMMLASPLLGASAILSLLAVLIPAKRRS